jgi:hypothetical protein
MGIELDVKKSTSSETRTGVGDGTSAMDETERPFQVAILLYEGVTALDAG